MRASPNGGRPLGRHQASIEADLAGLLAHPHRPNPFTLDADNHRVDPLPDVAAGISSGRAYVITVARDVLAIDCDNPDAAPALERFETELRSHGWPVQLVASGRRGHRHLWAVITDDRARARFTDRAVELGLDRPRRHMRPPGAPHRLDLPVALLGSPEHFADAVRAVRDPRQALSGDWQGLLRTGCLPLGKIADRSGSAMVFQICREAHRAGHDLDTVRGWLADHANKGGDAYRKRLKRSGKGHGDYWLTHYVWPPAVQAAGRRLTVPVDATEARARIDVIREAVAAHQWKGPGGATEWSILVTLLDRGYERGSLTPTMSYREIAEVSRRSTRTITRAIPRLRTTGWLQVADAGRGTTQLDSDGAYRELAMATRWRLVMPHGVAARSVHTGGTPPASTSLSGVTSRDPANRGRLDVLRWNGLSLNGERVIDALSGGPLTTKELADKTQLNRGNLRSRLLPRLAASGLIVAANDRWTLADDLDAALEAAAEEYGLAGKTDAVTKAHVLERRSYLEQRERNRPKRLAKSTALKDARLAEQAKERRRQSSTREGRCDPDETRPASAPFDSGSPRPVAAVVVDPAQTGDLERDSMESDEDRSPLRKPAPERSQSPHQHPSSAAWFLHEMGRTTSRQHRRSPRHHRETAALRLPVLL